MEKFFLNTNIKDKYQINNSGKNASNNNKSNKDKQDYSNIENFKNDLNEKKRTQPLHKKLTFFQEKSNKLEKPSLLNLKENFYTSPINNLWSVTYSSNDFSGCEEKEEGYEDEEYEDEDEEEEFEDEEYEDEEYEDEEYEDEYEEEEYEDEKYEEEDKGYFSDSTHSYIDSDLSISYVTKSEISEINEKSFSLNFNSEETSPKKKKNMNNKNKEDKFLINRNSIKIQKDKVFQIIPIKKAQNIYQSNEEKKKIDVSGKISNKINNHNNPILEKKKSGFLIESKDKKRNYINNLINKIEKNKNDKENKDRNKLIPKKNYENNEKNEDEKSIIEISDSKEDKNNLREVRRKISQRINHGIFNIFNNKYIKILLIYNYILVEEFLTSQKRNNISKITKKQDINFIKSISSIEEVKDFYDYTEECMRKMIKFQFPTQEELDSISVTLPFEEEIKNKKIAIFDLDETLFHCNIKKPKKAEMQIMINVPSGAKVQVISFYFIFF
jgi:hypothetical protein